ncbi:MAG: PepSY-like domain-containing protein [Microscillaceae bacterium]|nr:PepSY-like domain-containing protein [Microscillaceae bacterium]
MKICKNLLPVLLTLSLSACNLLSDELNPSSVPAKIQNVFKTQQAGARDIIWKKEGGKYLVQFKIKDTSKEIYFDKEANILETDTKVKTEDILPKIKDYLNKNHKDLPIFEVEKEENAQGTCFEVKLIKDHKILEVAFDEKGNYLKPKE